MSVFILFFSYIYIKSLVTYYLTFKLSWAADFDLTGQLVWPGAMLMNGYLSDNADILQGCSVLEFGSGVGNSSFFLS